MQKKVGFVHVAILAVILSAGLIGAAYMLSRFFIKLEKDKLLCVKGFAKKIVKSDIGYFEFTIRSKSNSTPADCYMRLNKAMALAIARLLKDGFKPEEISRGNIQQSEVYKKIKGKRTNSILYHTLNQSVRVKSKNVDLIKKKFRNLNSLLAKNINISVSSPQYFISDLNEYKIELLAKATENARLRAETIAGKSGAKIGKIVWAQQGVIQITEPLSTETSCYGLYDTDSLEKVIKIVVTIKYTVDK